MKNHEKAFSDIKNYYNDITLNNLALINSLKVIYEAHIFSSYRKCSLENKLCNWPKQHQIPYGKEGG